MVAATKARDASKRAKKRPAAAPSGDPAIDGAALKKPAAAREPKRLRADKQRKTGPWIKGLKINMKDVYEKLRMLRKSEITENAFRSRAYDAARRRCESQGAPTDQSQEFGRTESAKASKLYPKLKP